MSTEHQQYSIENQHDAIQKFADANGRVIVRSFVDAGKSGVTIRRRGALQELLRVVEGGGADFSAILVYDVSRWGRFQEPDEGAYYEFRCIRAGIIVEYCAEHFPADNSPMSAVMKSLKRAMSGELSRDLSTKVFAGQCRLITLGFRQGGTPGYGLRRLLLDQHGNPKTTLVPGQRKSFQLERVILTPGPDDEVATVRRVYALFTVEHKAEAEIAMLLNSEGIATATGRPWTRGTIHELLTNEKYIGNNLYNRTSTKLQQPRVKNKPEEWVRCQGAYAPLVDAEVFAIVNPRSRKRSTFEAIMANIASVGLKKPVTVHRRALEDDGTRYDLVYGQGRLESLQGLGETTIPAIISDAPEDERYLMSLVENLARRPPSTTDLVREVKRLMAQHFKPDSMAQKLGLTKSYITDIIRLLQHGEENLISRVEAGRLPIETAIKIATGTDADAQKALSDAYENETLRGAKLHAVQQLIARRKNGKIPSEPRKPITGKDLVRMYERHTQEQRALVHRSALITERLAVLRSCFRRLMADDHFVTLLRAEGFRDMPEHLTTPGRGGSR